MKDAAGLHVITERQESPMSILAQTINAWESEKIQSANTQNGRIHFSTSFPSLFPNYAKTQRMGQNHPDQYDCVQFRRGFQHRHFKGLHTVKPFSWTPLRNRDKGHQLTSTSQKCVQHQRKHCDSSSSRKQVSYHKIGQLPQNRSACRKQVNYQKTGQLAENRSIYHKTGQLAENRSITRKQVNLQQTGQLPETESTACVKGNPKQINTRCVSVHLDSTQPSASLHSGPQEVTRRLLRWSSCTRWTPAFQSHCLQIGAMKPD